MSLIAIRLWGSASETAITLVDETALPQVIPGLAAGDYEIGRAALVWSGTKTTVIDPPPPGTDYANFGANTLAGAGGFAPLDEVGNPITLTGVVSQTGATRTWSISNGRLIANGTPDVDAGKSIVVSTASGNKTLVVAVDAGAWDVTTGAELLAAVDAARANSLFASHRIFIREGITIPSVTLLSKSMPGTLVWPNWDRTDLTVDMAAIASLAGGAIDISCRTRRKAGIGLIAKTGSPGISFTGLVINGQQGSYSAAQCLVTKNVTHTASGAHLFTDCRFDQLNNANKGLWCHSLIVEDGQCIAQDCEFSGGYICYTSSKAITHSAVVRGVIRRQGVDGIRQGFNLQVMAGDPAFYSQCLGNLIYDLDADPQWVTPVVQHSDGIQTGSDIDGNGRPFKLLYIDNRINLARQLPGYSQGIYCDDTTTSVLSGYICGNLIRVSAVHGIRTWRNGFCSMVVRGNTCVPANDWAIAPQTVDIGKLSGNPIVVDNIAGVFTAYSDPVVYDNNISRDKNNQADMFEGAFVSDARGDVAQGIDQATPAAFKASFEAAYAVKPGGPADGRGFQFRRSVLPGAGAPSLTGLSDIALTTSGGEVEATVGVANTFVFWVATTSATPPTAQQIINGANHLDAAPLSAGRFLAPLAGLRNWIVDGAALGQDFWVHAIARSTDDLRSAVQSTAKMTVPSSLAPSVALLLSHPTNAQNPVTTTSITPSGKPLLIVRTSASGLTTGESYVQAKFGATDLGAPVSSGFNARNNVQAWVVPNPGTSPVTLTFETTAAPRSAAVHVIELTDIAAVNTVGGQNGAGGNSSGTSVMPQVTTQFPGSLVFYALSHFYDAAADTLTGATLLAQGKSPGTSTSNDHEWTLAYEIVDTPGVTNATLTWTTSGGNHGRAIELKAG